MDGSVCCRFALHALVSAEFTREAEKCRRCSSFFEAALKSLRSATTSRELHSPLPPSCHASQNSALVIAAAAAPTLLPDSKPSQRHRQSHDARWLDGCRLDVYFSAATRSLAGSVLSYLLFSPHSPLIDLRQQRDPTPVVSPMVLRFHTLHVSGCRLSLCMPQ